MGSSIHVPRPHYKPPESTSERGTVRSPGRGKVAAINIYAAGEAFRTKPTGQTRRVLEVSRIPAAEAAGFAEWERRMSYSKCVTGQITSMYRNRQ